MSLVRAAGRIAVIAPATLIGVAVQWGALKLGLAAARRIPILYHRLVCRVLGIRVSVTGEAPRDPALILANHVSWLDIPTISTLMPVSFVAKSEIASWPLFGTLARLQRSVFVDRTKRHATGEANGAIAARLAQGEAIVLFAEGTTGDGTRVLPFRSALVGAARAALADPSTPRIVLQPLSIAYVARDGLSLGRAGRPQVAWFGDVELLAHLMGVLRSGPLDVSIAWGEPIAFDAGVDRKAATKSAEAAVRYHVRATLAGRALEPS